jgi:hypothetical protein
MAVERTCSRVKGARINKVVKRAVMLPKIENRVRFLSPLSGYPESDSLARFPFQVRIVQ